MEFIVGIYVISMIGIILSIRYDGGKDPNVTSLYKYYKQMGRRIVYTCDCCGSIIDLDKQVGILAGFNAENAIDEDWELKYRKYLCDKCSEKVLLFIRK